MENQSITNSLNLSTVTEELTPAPKILRLINLLIDSIAIAVFLFSFLTIIQLLGFNYILDFILEIPDLLFGLICYLIYYLPFEAITGRTIGKYITGTKVVTVGNEEYSIYHAAGRSFLRCIPFEALSIFRSCNLCWHDSIMNTVVIKSR